MRIAVFGVLVLTLAAFAGPKFGGRVGYTTADDPSPASAPTEQYSVVRCCFP